MKKLTVIIPFLNEGKEIENTVRSIRQTTGDQVEIILIDDNSQDQYNYREIATKYGARYHYNAIRQGVGHSRDIGVEMVEQDYFIILDGHMRFYENNWNRLVVDCLERDERALYCAGCKPLNAEAEVTGKTYYGAWIEMEGKEKPFSLFNPVWIRSDLSPEQRVVDIPCVLGASYAASKSYWQYLKGLEGLRSYGLDETYISLKVWLEGGRCKVIKDLEIGHIFREQFPYFVDYAHVVYNKLLITETLLPSDIRYDVYNILRKEEGVHLGVSRKDILLRKEEISKLKKFYKKMQTVSYSEFLEFNRRVKEMDNVASSDIK